VIQTTDPWLAILLDAARALVQPLPETESAAGYVMVEATAYRRLEAALARFTEKGTDNGEHRTNA